MNKYQFKFLVPLINFACEVPKIELGKGFTLRKISNYEKREINKLIQHWCDTNYGRFLLEYVISMKNSKSSSNDFFVDVRLNIEKFLTILRLYKKNILGFNIILQPTEEPAPYSTENYTLKHYRLRVNPDVQFLHKKYSLYKKEESHFKKFFKELYQKKFAHCEVATTYFNKSYSEPHTPFEPLKDLLLSLENLYLRDEKQELAYKLAVRLAHNLGNTYKKKQKIFYDIQHAYELLNTIWYSGEVKQVENYDLLFRIREYTRESLITFIKDPNLIDCQKLDAIVLR
jgi:hypothetical protein